MPLMNCVNLKNVVITSKKKLGKDKELHWCYLM